MKGGKDKPLSAREHLRVEQEIERRAAEMHRKHLASVTKEKRKKIEQSQKKATRDPEPAEGPTLDAIAVFKEEKRRRELAEATERVREGEKRQRKKDKKARKRVSQKKRAAEERQRRAEAEVEFGIQIEAAKRASLEEVSKGDEPKPSDGNTSNNDA